MDLLKTILDSSLLSNLLWVLLIIVVLLVFKKQLVDLFERLKEAEWAGSKVKFDQPKISFLQQPQKASKENSIFWLGHDMMWTMDVIMRGAGNDYILHGLRQSIFHAKTCGLDEQAETLDKLRQNIQTQPKALSPEDRVTLVSSLRAITDEIAQKFPIT